MADNKRKLGSDRRVIALSEPYEVAHWSKTLKVSPAKLRSVVRKIGLSAKQVRAYLDFQAHAARDKKLIALSQSYEVAYWSKKFKVTPGKLRAAVKTVGRSSNKVGAYFKQKRSAKRKAA